MKCWKCDGTGTTKGWISEPCTYCGGTGELPDDFSEMTKLKRCKKCGGEAVFSGVFDDPTTYRFPECMKCGARAEGNSVKDSWYERARKWNEQNTLTNEEWLERKSTKEKAEWLFKLTYKCYWCGREYTQRSPSLYNEKECPFKKCMKDKKDFEKWLKEEHNE